MSLHPDAQARLQMYLQMIARNENRDKNQQVQHVETARRRLDADQGDEKLTTKES